VSQGVLKNIYIKKILYLNKNFSMRRLIVARQLSGDLSKINPSLALNQQANALPYNPKLEIER